MADFYDFDQAVGEIEPRLFTFQFEGDEYTVDLNVDAGKLFMWMEAADTVAALPFMLRIFLSDEQYEKITNSGALWPKMEALVQKLAAALGSGSGN